MPDNARRSSNPLVNVGRTVVRLVTLPFRVIIQIFTGGGTKRKDRR